MTRFRNTGQPDWDWWGRLWPDPGDVLEAVGLPPDAPVAEIGCGNGYFALPAAERAGTVYAVDVDEDLLSELRTRAERRGVSGRIETVRGDARDLTSLLPERVAFALLANVLHGVSEKPAFLREARRALAPDGRLAVVNWRDRPRAETTLDGEPRGPPTDLRMSERGTERTVEDAGFAVERTVDLPPFHYAVVAERRSPGER